MRVILAFKCESLLTQRVNLGGLGRVGEMEAES